MCNTCDHLWKSLSATALLNASCQAVVETYLAPSGSPWYASIDALLGQAQALVRQWRLSGNLYFGQTIVSSTKVCGDAILGTESKVLATFDQLAKQFSAPLRDQLVAQLKSFEPSIQSLTANLGQYESQLKAWYVEVDDLHTQLTGTVGKIQAQESQLQADIAATNAQINTLQQQIADDRKKIADAQSKRTGGILETVFGVILVPFTGGASLVLAGFGVATLVEAQAEVKAFESNLQSARDQIVSDQIHLSDDQKQVVNLQGVVASANMVANDVDSIQNSLDSLRTDWSLLDQNLNGSLQKLDNATSSQEVILERLWFEATCNEWRDIQTFIQSLQDMPTTTVHVTIGS